MLSSDPLACQQQMQQPIWCSLFMCPFRHTINTVTQILTTLNFCFYSGCSLAAVVFFFFFFFSVVKESQATRYLRDFAHDCERVLVLMDPNTVVPDWSRSDDAFYLWQRNKWTFCKVPTSDITYNCSTRWTEFKLKLHSRWDTTSGKWQGQWLQVIQTTRSQRDLHHTHTHARTTRTNARTYARARAHTHTHTHTQTHTHTHHIN